MAEPTAGPGHYPQKEALEALVVRRHRVSTTWRYLLLAATVFAVIVLLVLLVTIINQSFGLAAVQNEVPPEALVNDFLQAQILGAANTVASEDDSALAAGIAADPNATGFLGYAPYAANAGALRPLAVDGVAPSAETVASGDYPLVRPLYLYVSPEVIAERPQAAAFAAYVLAHGGEELADAGYFPADDEALARSRAALAEAAGLAETPADVDPAGVSGAIAVAGSSTVYPLLQRLGDRFVAGGFGDSLTIESVGTDAGLRQLCVDRTADIAAASRPITPLEIEACRASGREPVALQIGTDALVVVVAQANGFAEEVSGAQLQELFTTAATWADVDADLPAEPIRRFVPGAQSGTLDFFGEVVFDLELADLPKDALVLILEANISRGLGRRLERDQRFFDDRLVFEDPVLWDQVCASAEPAAGCTLPARDQASVYQLVQERVVAPTVIESWKLIDSLRHREAITLRALRAYPGATVDFYQWLTPSFITSPQSSKPEVTGVRTAILGSLWVIAITILFAFPLGVGAAIYLEEYADQSRWTNRLIQTNINNLAGVPSIIYGMLGLAVFVRALEPITSGAVFGVGGTGTSANGRTILSAGLTLALLILPLIIISAQEAIRAVPGSLRRASYGLGATRWQTIWHHVLPSALPGILTGTILSVSRAIGETAPLVVIGASTFIPVDPSGPFSKFTVLPIQIYQWTTRPQGAFRNIAAAAIVVLLVLLLALNATAVILRNRSTKRLA